MTFLTSVPLILLSSVLRLVCGFGGLKATGYIKHKHGIYASRIIIFALIAATSTLVPIVQQFRQHH